jgi:hypothetical protein
MNREQGSRHEASTGIAGTEEEAMTPEERKLVEDLFERLRTLENAPRDADAVDAINRGLDLAPNALYPLVQSVLVQDEALKRADARIRELEKELGIEPPQGGGQGGFLDNMRDTLLGKNERRGSVPPVRQNPNAWGPAYNQGAPMQSESYGRPPYGQQPVPPQDTGGSSFLGTAAATVAGVVGGALLMNSFKNMFGGQQQGNAKSAFDQPSGGAPWGGGSSGGDLARDAGLDDIGRNTGRSAAFDDPGLQRAGLFGGGGEQDQGAAEYAADSDDFDSDDNDIGGDFDVTDT